MNWRARILSVSSCLSLQRLLFIWGCARTRARSAVRWRKNFLKRQQASGHARGMLEIFRQPAAMVALLSMVLGQMVMVLVMVITSLHMRGHNHGLTDISIVISSHTFGMYAFSIFSGRLADRWGRGPVIVTGSATLILRLPSRDDLPGCAALGCGLIFTWAGLEFLLCGRFHSAGRSTFACRACAYARDE